MIDDAALEQRLVRVTAIREAAVDTRCFELVAADRRPLPPFTPGAHVDVLTPAGQVRQYSLCGDARDASRYTIAVKLEHGGRGGSRSMHEDVEPGSALGMVGPRNHFPLAADAACSLFIAGGIGITPILAMIRSLAVSAQPWELHYCARSAAHAAFCDELRALPGGTTTPWFSETPLLDANALLAEVRTGTHVYCCGPAGLMAAVKDASAHWPADHVHFEWFAAPERDDAPATSFEVQLSRSGMLLEIPAHRSILEVVREHGVEVASSCEDGVCGTCETRVLEGECDHRDLLLSADERASNRTMMICVSRAKSPRLVLAL